MTGYAGHDWQSGETITEPHIQALDDAARDSISRAEVAATYGTLPAGITAAKPTLYRTNFQAYNFTASSLRHWRTAVARTRAGGAAARLHCYGDSITFGLYAPDPKQNWSYPQRLRSILNATKTLGDIYEGPLWLEFVQPVNGGATKPDSRYTIGSGWVGVTGMGPGGVTGLQNVSTTNRIDFGPVTCDSFTVYGVNSTSSPQVGGIKVGVDGGATSVVAASQASADGWYKYDVTGLTLGAHTLNIENYQGGIVLGVSYSDSTRTNPGILLSGCGASGTTTAQWAAHDDGRRSLYTAFDMVVPDLVVIGLGSNDFGTNVDPAVTAANLTALVAKVRSNSGDPVLLVPVQPMGTQTYAWQQYRQAIYSVADAQNVALVDITDRWVDNSVSPTLYTDAYHPSMSGYFDIAQTVADALLGA